MQISKGYDSYLDERGQGKAKKLVNIAIYRSFDRMSVRFGVAMYNLLTQKSWTQNIKTVYTSRL